ncbi:MAG: MFS transporter [Oscillospiraceae bacterium]|nr:MFS transporter [Oscillospiraceae bacterium]
MNDHKSGFRKFLLLWMGELISSIGGGLTSFGLAVYVFNETGSAASMAVVSLLAFLPTLLLSVPAGVLADRHDRRLLMMIGDGFSGLGIVYILLCMLGGGASLLQICIGVSISSVFSALLEPSYRATITEMLTEEEYSKASGMVSLAGSARYLVSPVLAGLLLAVSDIKLLLFIDICTFAFTVITTAVVKKGIVSRKPVSQESFFSSIADGWKAITEKKGLFVLIMVSSLITCFMGTLQILVEPMVLDFSDSTTLGVTETVCACGMLVSSFILGVKGIKSRYVTVLSLSLAFAGLAMAVFGLKQNIYLMCIAGFLFFAMLPFANSCLDYLARINIPEEKQGRAWGLIGFLSQLGYVVAYGLSGILADGIAAIRNISVGRGAAWVVIAAGVLMCLTSVSLSFMGSVKKLERKD